MQQSGVLRAGRVGRHLGLQAPTVHVMVTLSDEPRSCWLLYVHVAMRDASQSHSLVGVHTSCVRRQEGARTPSTRDARGRCTSWAP